MEASSTCFCCSFEKMHDCFQNIDSFLQRSISEWVRNVYRFYTSSSINLSYLHQVWSITFKSDLFQAGIHYLRDITRSNCVDVSNAESWGGSLKYICFCLVVLDQSTRNDLVSEYQENHKKNKSCLAGRLVVFACKRSDVTALHSIKSQWRHHIDLMPQKPLNTREILWPHFVAPV